MAQESRAAPLIKIITWLSFAVLTHACPFPCTCTEFKVNCYSKGLKEVPDNFPPDVISIDLQYNEIETINDQFHNLTALEEVMLRFNRISFVADSAFSNLPNLNHINLGSNLLTSLNGSAFQNVSQMKILDLTDNQLTSVDGSFQGLPSLTKLVLTRNLIDQLTESSLQPLSNLIYFMAEENRISHVHPAAFSSLIELSFVSLIKNPLVTMDDVLSTNERLSHLNLDDCQLTGVPAGLPWATRNLQLRRNNISTISRDTFAATRYLGILMLDDNNITQVESGAFMPIAHLQELWLNGNHLSAIPTPLPSTVHSLSIDNNAITSVTSVDFPHDSQMKTLSLRGNQIMRIDPFTFSSLTSLQELYLWDNVIVELLDKSFFGMRNLTLLQVGHNPIMHIDVRFAAGLHNLEILDLSHIKDTEPFMRGNFFRDIPFLKNLLLRNSPSLTRNILMSNETLKSFYNLQELDVSDNNLKTLDMDLPRFFPNLQGVRMGGNAWVCDPDLLWLHDWMQTSRHIFLDVEQVRCAQPWHLAGAVIADLPYHAFFYTTTVTPPTTEESVGSGDADSRNETETPELTTPSSGNPSPGISQSDDDSTPSERTDGNTDPKMLTTSDMGRVQKESTAMENTKPHGSTTVVTKTTAYDGSNDTGERSSKVKGQTATTAWEKGSTGTSDEHSSTHRKVTTTAMSQTSKIQATPLSSNSPHTTSTAENTTITTIITNTSTPLQPTDVPRYGGSKIQTNTHSSSFTRTLIIATCATAVVLIIIVVALVLIVRNRQNLRLALHRTLAPRRQTGDTELVLSDQDEPDSKHDCSPMTQLSESEHGTTPCVETASDDGLCTRLV